MLSLEERKSPRRPRRSFLKKSKFAFRYRWTPKGCRASQGHQVATTHLREHLPDNLRILVDFLRPGRNFLAKKCQGLLKCVVQNHHCIYVASRLLNRELIVAVNCRTLHNPSTYARITPPRIF